MRAPSTGFEEQQYLVSGAGFFWITDDMLTVCQDMFSIVFTDIDLLKPHSILLRQIQLLSPFSK